MVFIELDNTCKANRESSLDERIDVKVAAASKVEIS